MPTGLTWGVALAVLFGALLHAGWNALVKSSDDKALDTVALHLTGAALVVPILAVTGWPPQAAWPYLLASMAIHVGYYLSLTGAYEHGDLGLTYPLMRGTAPMLVALSSGAVLGEPLSPGAWAGAIGICGGVLVLGLSRHALARPKAVAFALANAVAIALYTVVDGLGVRAATRDGGNALQYVATLFLLNGWPFAAIVVRRRGVRVSAAYLRRRAPVATLGAAASLAAYGIALWAMTQAPVAVVAALRETSVLFAALLGTWLLKEVFTPRRAVGTAVIVAGVVALRLG
jgi:phosphonate utilization associated putative membrane protein